MFVNKLSEAYATMHSMGLQYSKTSEGSDYPNVTMPGYDETLNTANAVPPVEAGISPGNCVVYKWIVPEIAGPNNDEPARVRLPKSASSLFSLANSTLPDALLSLLRRPHDRHKLRSHRPSNHLLSRKNEFHNVHIPRIPPFIHGLQRSAILPLRRERKETPPKPHSSFLLLLLQHARYINVSLRKLLNLAPSNHKPSPLRSLPLRTPILHLKRLQLRQ